MSGIDRDELFLTNDGSDEAVGIRLRAARIAAGYHQQRDFSDALQIKYQTYHSQEKKGRPTASTVRFLYKKHRIDFNFVFNGDYSQLPGDVQTALESVLSAQTL